MKKILIINGPNLNLLGRRETDIYGKKSFDLYLEELKNKHQSIFFIDYFQSNIEGEIINKIQDVNVLNIDGVILNAAGYTHTSVAIRDAISSSDTVFIEVHISNVFARENFRKNSLISEVCNGSVSGFGLKSYELALLSFLK